jgi:hypothetical protein
LSHENNRAKLKSETMALLRHNSSGRQANGQKPIQLWHPDVPGPLWNGTRRVRRKQIQTYCRVLAREFRPKRIILFGSYAYGKPTLDSDVDLVVVMPFRGRDLRMMGDIRARVGAPFPMDLLVWTPERARKTDYFTQEVVTRGKVMYES